MSEQESEPTEEGHPAMPPGAMEGAPTHAEDDDDGDDRDTDERLGDRSEE